MPTPKDHTNMGKNNKSSPARMTLKDFIAQALSDIVLGIREAQLAIDEFHGQVNPYMLPEQIKDSTAAMGETEDGAMPTPVDFDIVVTTSRSEGDKGGGGIFVGGFGLGLQGESSQGSSQQSRIKFRVPLVLPTHELTWDPERKHERRYSVLTRQNEAQPALRKEEGV